MKHILIAAVLAGCTLFGGEIHWMHSYKEGTKLAKEVHKPMLLFIYKPGCGACEFMEEDVFTDKLIYPYVNQAYIPVKLNINHNDAPKTLQAVATPTFHFVDSKGHKLRESLIGGRTGQAMLDILKDAVAHFHP